MDDKLKAKVEEVKQNGLPVFSVKIGANTYVYRGINRREFRELQSMMAKLAEDLREKYKENEAKLNSEIALLKEKGEEKLVVKCMLSPHLASDLDVDAIPAGAITKLADLVMKASGFDDGEPEQLTQL